MPIPDVITMLGMGGTHHWLREYMDGSAGRLTLCGEWMDASARTAITSAPPAVPPLLIIADRMNVAMGTGLEWGLMGPFLSSSRPAVVDSCLSTAPFRVVVATLPFHFSLFFPG